MVIDWMILFTVYAAVFCLLVRLSDASDSMAMAPLHALHLSHVEAKRTAVQRFRELPSGAGKPENILNRSEN